MYVATPRERLIGIQERVELSRLVTAKPYLRVLIPAIAGAVTEFTFAFALGSAALRAGKTDVATVTQLINSVRDDINSRLTVIGHRVWYANLQGQPGTDITATLYIQNSAGTVTWATLADYVFSAYPDTQWAIQNYAESEAIAKARFGDYVQGVDINQVDAILQAAAEGYYDFMTAGTPSGKQMISALKHVMRMAGVDRQLYLQRLQEGAQVYRLDSLKYGEALGVVFRALDASVKLIVDYARNR